MGKCEAVLGSGGGFFRKKPSSSTRDLTECAGMVAHADDGKTIRVSTPYEFRTGAGGCCHYLIYGGEVVTPERRDWSDGAIDIGCEYLSVNGICLQTTLDLQVATNDFLDETSPFYNHPIARRLRTDAEFRAAFESARTDKKIFFILPGLPCEFVKSVQKIWEG